MLVEVIWEPGPRSKLVCSSIAHGIQLLGDRVHLTQEEFYNGPIADVAVFYGLKGNLRQAFIDYRRIGRKAIYIDLGYWGRVEGGKIHGYHKIAVNDRHPTAYFQNKRHEPNRFRRFHLEIEPWKRSGKHILVAGMGAKAAKFEGFAPLQWERQAIATLRKHTDRPILYRPKPSWRDATGIDEVGLSDPTLPLDDFLRDCYAVVSHHSNVCVDALLAGVPVFCEQGVASVLGKSDLAEIENPLYPDGREQWAFDIAWTQWRAHEMSEGRAWLYLKAEGLV